jgi:BASS family bile acid:Na+ symporter
VFGMVGVAVSLMSGLPDFAVAKPAFTTVVTVATFAVNIGLQIFAAAVFWRIGRKAAVTIGLITGNTNVALVLAAVSESASYDLLVYFVVGQFPIYILPLVAVPIYRRIVGAR